MPSDSDWDWDWIVEPSAPTTITIYEEEIEEVAVLYDADGNVIRRFTDSRKQPMGFALKQVKRGTHGRNRKHKH